MRFFLSQLENSLIRDCLFLSSGSSNCHFSPFSQTSLYLYWREKFFLNLRASLVPAYYRDKFSFCKKKCIGLCFTDGNMWPSKVSNGPQKIGRGSNMALKITDLGTTLSLHERMYYLPKVEAYIIRWDPQFQ